MRKYTAVSCAESTAYDKISESRPASAEISNERSGETLSPVQLFLIFESVGQHGNALGDR